MHCPRCGTAASASQQFCRSCGLNLEKVAELVGESSAVETRGSKSLRLKELQRKHENWGGIAGLIAFGLILILFIAIVFSQIILKGGLLILPGSILILLALAAGVMGYFQASAKSLKQKLGEPQLPQPTERPLGGESIDPPMFRSAASVTEHTTKLLDDQNDRATHEIAS
jgi:hypothetical protein